MGPRFAAVQRHRPGVLACGRSGLPAGRAGAGRRICARAAGGNVQAPEPARLAHLRRRRSLRACPRPRRRLVRRRGLSKHGVRRKLRARRLARRDGGQPRRCAVDLSRCVRTPLPFLPRHAGAGPERHRSVRDPELCRPRRRGQPDRAARKRPDAARAADDGSVLVAGAGRGGRAAGRRASVGALPRRRKRVDLRLCATGSRGAHRRSRCGRRDARPRRELRARWPAQYPARRRTVTRGAWLHRPAVARA